MKVIVGLPSNGFVRIETVSSLAYMLSSTPGLVFDLTTPLSCYIHENRDKIAERAISMDSDYVLFIDADMKFPEDSLVKLASHNVDIIGAMYNYRDLPKRTVVKLDPKYTDEYKIEETDRPDRIMCTLSNPGRPFRVRAVGTGLMLIKTEVFKKIPRPWFFFQPNIPGTCEFVGEDVWFCDKAREFGYDVWVDPTIEVGHIGSTVF